jgi:flagellar biosynthesis protein FlhB
MKARKEGKTAKSRMVSVTVQWWALLAVLFPAFSWVRNGTLVQWMNYKVWTPEVAIVEASWLGCKVICLLVAAIGFSGVAVGLAQTKGLFLPSQLLSGVQQYRPGAFFGKVKESCIDMALGGVRCGVLLALVVPVVFTVAKITPSAFQSSADAAAEGFYVLIRGVFFRGGYGLLIIALVAYSLARWRFYKQLRMSLQEVRDEYKEDEGDPHTKAARKHEHRMLLFSEVEKRVKKSKVVVVRRSTEGE